VFFAGAFTPPNRARAGWGRGPVTPAQHIMWPPTGGQVNLPPPLPLPNPLTNFWWPNAGPFPGLQSLLSLPQAPVLPNLLTGLMPSAPMEVGHLVLPPGVEQPAEPPSDVTRTVSPAAQADEEEPTPGATPKRRSRKLSAIRQRSRRGRSRSRTRGARHTGRTRWSSSDSGRRRRRPFRRSIRRQASRTPLSSSRSRSPRQRQVTYRPIRPIRPAMVQPVLETPPSAHGGQSDRYTPPVEIADVSSGTMARPVRVPTPPPLLAERP